MSFDDRLRMTLTIERVSAGAEDAYGQPARTYATVGTVAGLIQPQTAREQASTSQAGAPISTHVVYVRPTDVREADRIAHAGVRYEITGVRNAAGLGHHLELDARLVGASPTVEAAAAAPAPAALVVAPKVPVVSHT